MKKFTFNVLIVLISQFTFAEASTSLNQNSNVTNDTSLNQNIESNKNNIKDWYISSTFIIPFRGFGIQTEAKNSQTQDPLDSISYSPSPSLEGALSLGYKEFILTYRHTLTSSSLDQNTDAPSSQNEEFRIGFLLFNQLFEFSSQRLVGLETQINLDNTQTKKNIARPDMSFTDNRLRWMYGIPIWGADQANSLSNFYTSASTPKNNKYSYDWIFGSEVIQQKISGSNAFIPFERKATFGTASTLSEVSTLGVGLGTGIGFTAMMQEKSFFSIAGLLGGNFNASKATFQDTIENVSGFGLYMSARMSVQFAFGEHNNQNLGFKLYVDSWSIPAKENNIFSTDAAMSLAYGINFN